MTDLKRSTFNFLHKVGVYNNPYSYKKALPYYRAGEWLLAKDLFLQAISENNESANSYFKLGMCFFRLGKYTEAREYIDAALRLAPTNVQWISQRLQVQRYLGNNLISSDSNGIIEYENEVRQLIEIDNKNAQAYNMLAEVLQRRGKWWQEIDALEKAVALDQSHPSWYYRLGDAQEKMKRFSEAAESFKKAITTRKREPAAEWYYRYGYCLEKSGTTTQVNKQEITYIYNKAIKKDRVLDAVNLGIGVFHQQRRLWEDAAHAYQKTSKTISGNSELYYRLGSAYDRCYKWEMAQENYKKAIELNYLPEWQFRYAFSLERGSKYEKAANNYYEAAKNRSIHTQYWFYRAGYCFYQAKNYKAACNSFIEMKSLIERETTILNEKQRRNSEQLILDIEEKLNDDITSSSLWEKLGDTCLRVRNYEKALDAYDQAIKRRDAHKFGLYWNVGLALYEMNRYEDACKYFNKSRIFQRAHGTSEANLGKNPKARAVSAYREFFDTLDLLEDTILYESFHGRSLTCNPYAIFKKAISDSRFNSFTHVCVVNDLSNISDDFKRSKNIVFVSRDSDAYIRYLATAKYLISNSTFPPYYVRRSGQIYLNTWHGTPWKTLGGDMKERFFEHKTFARNILQCTYLLSPNSHTSSIFINAHGVNKSAREKIIEYGYPRIDLTLENAHFREKLREQLKIDNENILLYAPTYRGDLTGISFDFERLKNDIHAMSSTGYKVLFRGHALLEGMLAEANLENIDIVPAEIDSNELLSIVDVLVTDYSSILFDYMPTGRPCILYAYDYEEYKSDRGLYFELDEVPGIPCFNIDAVVDTINNEDLLIKKAEFLYNKFKPIFAPYEDGNVSGKVLDLLYNGRDEKSRPAPNHKKTLLMYVGPFIPNGITTSALNLLNSIDYEKVDLYLIIDWSGVGNFPENVEQLNRLNSNINIICKFDRMNLSLEDRYVHSVFNNEYYFYSKELENVYYNSFEFEVRRLIGDLQYDCAINFEGYMRYWSSFFSQAQNNIIYQHNDLVSEMNLRFPYLRSIFESYSRYGKIISVSRLTMELNKDKISELYPVDCKKFDFCENMQDPEDVFRKASEPILPDDEQYFEDDVPVFINMGRLSPEKGQAKLILAFVKAIESGYKGKLIILGDGPLKGELNYLVKEHNAENYIIMAGWRFNPFPLMNRANCFILSSNHEGQPMVLLEALMIDKPIISTNIVGARSVLEGKGGMVVDNSIDGLAKGISEFLDGKINQNKFDIYEYQDEALRKFYKISGLI